MKAAPQLGTPSYCVGWGPAIDFNDRRQVSQVSQETCVPFSCYKDVLVLDEFSLSEPNAVQLKYFAPGVGNIRVGWKGDDAAKETLELVSLAQLGPEAMAQVGAQALELEKHAYEISKDVYGATSPLEAPATGAPAASGPAAAPPSVGSEAPAPAGNDPPPAALPRTGARPAGWRVPLLLAFGLGLGAAGWFVRRRAARR